MILGDVCTRNCAFCGVSKGKPRLPDPLEPQKIAKAVKKLNLNYVVVTSVTRDDLPDGGADQFKNVGTALVPCLPAGRAVRENLKVEFLIPDFQGSINSLKMVLEANPIVLNHNVETIPRLYKTIRPQADYRRSLDLLYKAKQLNPRVYTKSGFMVGLGEEDAEVVALLRDLREVGCDIVTIGQYLPPTKNHFQAARFVDPKIFNWYSRVGKKLGFVSVFSGPFVRSSYKAEEILCSQNSQKDY